MEDGTQDTLPPPERDPFTERSTVAQLWYEARLCLGFLTRIPVFSIEYSGHSTLAGASWAFPLVGVFVGIVGAIVLWLADGFGLASQLSAVLAIAAMTALTGALHEDGLADTADGFGLSGEIERRLAAMRDSSIGVYGMMTLILVFAARWIALADLVAISLSDGVLCLIAAAAISRGVMPYVMHSVPNARDDGLSVSAGRPEAKPALIALAIAAVLALIVFDFGDALIVLIVGALVAFFVATSARRLIGGQTGDVLGAVQQLTEAAVLVTAVGLAV